MEEVASIIIHLDCYDAIKCLPDELAGILFKSILCYGSTGELPKIDDWMKQRHSKSQEELEQEAQEFIKRHKAV